MESKKKERALGCECPFRHKHSCKLERVTQRELNQPRRTYSGSDFAKSIGVFDVGLSWVCEVRVVPNVKEVSGEPKALPLCDLEVLEQRKVPVLLAWAAIDIASKVAEDGDAAVTAQGGIEKGSSCEVRNI